MHLAASHAACADVVKQNIIKANSASFFMDDCSPMAKSLIESDLHEIYY
jgi:hypothetical protein